jgi:hypothetical protein
MSLPFRDSKVKCNEFIRKRKWKMSICGSENTALSDPKELQPIRNTAPFSRYLKASEKGIL